MPGLDLSQLSSNWKKLQEKLRSDKPRKSNALKRKRNDESNTTAARVKKAKTTAYEPQRRHNRNKMGLSSSKTQEPSNNTYTSLTRDHDISRADISQAYSTASTSSTPKPYQDEINGGLHSTHKIGKYLGLDCEMVGTGAPPYDDNVLARVSIVNFHGEQIYDSYVLPPPGITVYDYRTFVSGIREQHLAPGYARPYSQVQKDVAALLDNRILVGHAVNNDLMVLLLSHPRRDIRDTSRYAPFRALNHGRAPALRHLAKAKLGMQIQGGEHSSVEDARATMMLFKMEKVGFEEESRRRFGVRTQVNGKRVVVAEALPDEDDDGEDGGDDGEDDEEDDQRLLDGIDDEGDTNAEVVAVKQPKAAKKKTKRKKRTKRK